MDDLEEFKSWHEDLMAWERFQDELERIKPTKSRQRSANFRQIVPLFKSRQRSANFRQIVPLF